MGTLELAKNTLLIGAFAALACRHDGGANAARQGSAAELSSLQTPPQAELRPAPEPSSSNLPVDPDDGVWGSPLAPVTVVVFTDLECPFCARAHAMLVALERHYGEARLRVVVKHVPLAGHQGAVPAARVAQAVLALSGRGSFFRYLDHAFANQGRVAAGEALALAAELGLDRRTLAERAGSAAMGAQILGDVMLADRLAVSATPHYRINGLGLTGVRSFQELERVIDAELARATELRSAGVAASDVYARRVRDNFLLPEAQEIPTAR